MATPAGDKTLSRVALCSAIFAGFAYVSYSVVRDAVCRRGRGRDDEEERLRALRTIRSLSVASQTDLLLGNLDCSNGGILRHLSVQERIRELNLRARQVGDEGIIIKNSPFYRPRSLQSSPWSSPRILSPVDVQQFMSKSAENLTAVSPPASPIPRRKSMTKRGTHQRHLNGDEHLAPTMHQVTEVHILLKDSEETLKKRMDGLYNKGRVITPYEAQSLVALLYTKDEGLLLRTLTTITNCAAFSANQDYLREAGCLAILNSLIANHHSSNQVQMATVQAIGNLSLNKENMRELKNCIHALAERLEAATHDGGEPVLLPILITLSNLAVLPDWHGKYTKMLNVLYKLLDEGTETVRLQVCKILVNLSCNPAFVPHLLAAKAPRKFEELLDASKDEEFLLRLTTVVANLATTVQKHNIAVADLPAEEKAPSPETFYATLYGLNICDELKLRLADLTKHQNEEISSNAKKAFDCLCG